MSPDSAPLLREGMERLRRIVVKVGSRALLDDERAVDEAFIADLVGQVARLRATGREIVCVSSGAIAAGLGDLGLRHRPADLPSLQAAAAIGQARLMELYRRLFARHGVSIAQVLLTHDDLRSRERHLNARNTLGRLLRAGILPVINENDTVAVDEIRVGDNDLLSAMVAMLLRADALILLTTADGLLSAPPEQGGARIDAVEEITDEVRAMGRGAIDATGTGGMRTKLDAADAVTRCGECAIIAHAREPDVLPRLLAGEPIGTVFRPRPARMAGRKRWIAFFDHPRGSLLVDDGAARALSEDGRSLLAVGIRDVRGDFRRGDPVHIVDENGREVGRGLVNYAAADLRRIQGCRSPEIAGILGVCEFEEVMHRDNLVLV